RVSEGEGRDQDDPRPPRRVRLPPPQAPHPLVGGEAGGGKTPAGKAPDPPRPDPPESGERLETRPRPMAVRPIVPRRRPSLRLRDRGRPRHRAPAAGVRGGGLTTDQTCGSLIGVPQREMRCGTVNPSSTSPRPSSRRVPRSPPSTRTPATPI